MNELEFINFDINRKKRTVLLNEGYCADCYYIDTMDDKRVVKIFENNKSAKLEYNAILKLKENENSIIRCPEILGFSQNVLVMKFEEGEGFYDFLRYKKNTEKASWIFFELGKFLASFHNKNRVGGGDECITMIHGDLNSKNFLFLDNKKLFIMDPKGEIGNFYDDIVGFILNFYPPNLIFEILLAVQNKRERFINNFLEGYIQISDIKIKEDALKDDLIRILKMVKIRLSKKIFYRFKKVVVNIIIDNLIKKIKNGRIQISIHK